MRQAATFVLVIALAVSIPMTAVGVRFAEAEVITAGAMLRAEEGQSTSADHRRVEAFFARTEVLAALRKYGVSESEARLRLASLSDAEAAQLAAEIERAPAGADGVGAVIGAVLFIFVLLLITDILGFTKVFPFTRSVR